MSDPRSTSQDRAVALVTGSRGGIGVAIIAALQADGFLVAGADRVTGEPTSADLDLELDVTDEESCRKAVADVVERFGRLDVLVNNAGVMLRQPLIDLDFEVARGVFDVNVWGTLQMTKAAQPALFDSDRASVVMISSINGELGIRGGATYGMSKAALLSLTRTLAVEWAHVPVRVNAVSPAMVPTAMNEDVRRDAAYLEAKLQGIPLGRTVQPGEVADAVAYLAGRRSSSITGDVLHTDGGAVLRFKGSSQHRPVLQSVDGR